jgi:hypothetical protein
VSGRGKGGKARHLQRATLCSFGGLPAPLPVVRRHHGVHSRYTSRKTPIAVTEEASRLPSTRSIVTSPRRATTPSTPKAVTKVAKARATSRHFSPSRRRSRSTSRRGASFEAFWAFRTCFLSPLPNGPFKGHQIRSERACWQFNFLNSFHQSF